MGDKSNIITLHFKYRGVFDYVRLYNEGRQFFLDRDFEFLEAGYKDKGNEFEPKWKVVNRIDAYNQAIYAVEFKAFDMVPVVKDGKTLYNGKLQMKIEGTLEENYDQSSPAGAKIIFPDTKDKKQSLLHKLYKKVTHRDRYEKLAEDIFVTANNFQALMKEVCNLDTK